jgi:acetyltransferase-like isoleucine patch superfamily enzyme
MGLGIKSFIRKKYQEYQQTHALRRLHKGRNVIVKSPHFICGAENIVIEDNVRIGPYCRIESIGSYSDKRVRPQVRIREGTSIEWHFILVCVNEIDIGENVMIATNVFITDTTHGYADGTKPYLHQPILEGEKTKIGNGVWIGANSIISHGVTVGDQSIIGAGSLVNRDIPPYSIAVGSPAKVVKKFDHETKVWKKV